MHVNPKIKLRKRRAPKMRFGAGPQTKLRTDRKLPVLYYISYGYVFTHTNHHSKKSAWAVGVEGQKLLLNFNCYYIAVLTVAWVDRSEIGIPRTDPNLRGKATFITVIFEHAQ